MKKLLLISITPITLLSASLVVFAKRLPHKPVLSIIEEYYSLNTSNYRLTIPSSNPICTPSHQKKQ